MQPVRVQRLGLPHRNDSVHEQLRSERQVSVRRRPQLAAEKCDCGRDPSGGHLVHQRWGTVQALSVAGHDVIGRNSWERVPETTRRSFESIKSLAVLTVI